VALKNVSCNEPFFQGHWPGRPIMPGVLIVEALAQAAGLLVGHGLQPGRDALLASLDGVKLRRPVVPGDQLRLEVSDVRRKGRAAQVRTVARVDGRVVAEAKIRFMVIETGRAS
jgi:3-hydroxymyristoyl/3-hydroxydecanoyl-(acyl carrier protein) dehydratase